MWRLNVKKVYLKKIFELKRFFINEKHDFKPNDILLLQLVKTDAPKDLGRVRGLLFFESLEEDFPDESVELYGVKWKYVIKASKTVSLPNNTWFNLEDVVRPEYVRKYLGQAEAVKLQMEDAEIIRAKLLDHLSV